MPQRRSTNGVNEVVPRKLIWTRVVTEATFVQTLPKNTHRNYEFHIYEYTLEQSFHPSGIPCKLGKELPLKKIEIEDMIRRGTIIVEW